MALGKFGPRDWFAGFLVSLSGGNGANNVYVPAVTLVDSTGSPTAGGDVTIAGPLGQALSAASIPVVIASDQSSVPANITGGSVGLLGGTASIGFLGGFSYNNISTDTTTQVKSGAGVIHSVSVNTAGTVASSVSIYDSTTTTTPVIAIVSALATGYFILDASFSSGLRVVTTGTVAPNVTITYR